MPNLAPELPLRPFTSSSIFLISLLSSDSSFLASFSFFTAENADPKPPEPGRVGGAAAVSGGDGSGRPYGLNRLLAEAMTRRRSAAAACKKPGYAPSSGFKASIGFMRCWYKPGCSRNGYPPGGGGAGAICMWGGKLLGLGIDGGANRCLGCPDNSWCTGGKIGGEQEPDLCRFGCGGSPAAEFRSTGDSPASADERPINELTSKLLERDEVTPQLTPPTKLRVPEIDEH